MPTFLEEVQNYFHQSNLYDVFGVSKDATKTEIKKAYYKLSIITHPDKVDLDDRENATKKFQILGKIYSVLSDANLRSVYDDTGSVDEDDESIQRDKDWSEYWRLLFPKISVNDIEEYEKKYKGSQEEIDDLIRVYKKCEGDMEVIMEEMLCSQSQDEQRYRDIIDGLIERKELKSFKKYTSEEPRKKKARLAKAAKEEIEAKKMLDELKKKNTHNDNGDNDDDDDDDGAGGSLSKMILRNKQNREQETDNFLAKLEEKYSKKEKKQQSSSRSTKNKTSPAITTGGSGGKKTKSKKK